MGVVKERERGRQREKGKFSSPCELARLSAYT